MAKKLKPLRRLPLPKTIPLSRCEEGVIYEVHSRNLQFGVFVKAKAGFIGIRTKFGERFLFMEYHTATGPPYGTAKPLKRIGVVPKKILLLEWLGSMDKVTKKRVAAFEEYGKGWYFLASGKPSKRIKPVAVHNKKLFRFLQGVGVSFLLKCQRCRQRLAPSRLDKTGHCIMCLVRMDFERRHPMIQKFAVDLASEKFPIGNNSTSMPESRRNITDRE